MYLFPSVEEPVRLALAQVDAAVGDIEGNAALVSAAIFAAEEQGAAVTLLPELVLTGYPPEDLLARDSFVEDNLAALEKVAAGCRRRAVVGFVDRAEDGALYNAAALCGDGRVLQVYHKRRLPNYGVFDEERYFRPGAEEGLVEIGSERVAVTVCEDVWVPELVAEDAEDGARLVLNISASPFHLQKGRDREEMLRARCRDNRVWMAYCNLVGGQDELVFDGRSVVISPTGEVVARAKSFEEDLLVVDVDVIGHSPTSGRVEPMPEGPAEVYAALTLGLRDYLRKNGFSDVVLGLSGGIDSALTATLAADTLGGGRVHGVLMPSAYSSAGSLTDARELAANLGIDVRELPIAAPYGAFLETLKPSFDDLPFDVTEENLQARVRGSLLMALSNKFGWIVLATGNKSELSVGYSTLYGDMVGGFAPIKDVFKTRVWELSRWRNTLPGPPTIPEASISKPPSAELRPGQTDQDSLPPYEQLDGILRLYVEEDASRADIAAAGFEPAVVERVCRMVDAAEYKRRQGPLGIKITPKAFGKDRRMPVTNRYRG
ncbi:MAG TPA: NAD+ synthase [Coriobacteriia bacterium]|jgi:NAD+ synthase (glutamine-hydrolysing)